MDDNDNKHHSAADSENDIRLGGFGDARVSDEGAADLEKTMVDGGKGKGTGGTAEKDDGCGCKIS